MAQQQAAPRSEAPRILSVALPRPYSLNGNPTAHFSTEKGNYAVDKDERGDITVTCKRSGRKLFIPKALAVLELGA